MTMLYKLSCNKICDATFDFDLFVEDITDINSITPRDGVIYEITHLALDTQQGVISHEPELKSKVEHFCTQNIYYSKNHTNDWGVPIETHYFTKNELDSIANTQSSTLYKFLVDGYYLIEGIVDSKKKVGEKNKENVNVIKDNCLNKKKTIAAYSNFIIHINKGLKPMHYKKNGKIQYVVRIETKSVCIAN